LISDDDGGRGENGAELAGGERFQGAQAGVELGRGQAAQAKEAAQKIFGGRFSLLGVAFDAAGNEIAVGIAASADMRDDISASGRRLASRFRRAEWPESSVLPG
jgi:hypothetical protein